MDLESILWPLVSIAGLATSLLALVLLYRAIRDSKVIRDSFMAIGARDTIIQIGKRLERRLKYFRKFENELKTDSVQWVKDLKKIVSLKKKGAKKS